MDQDELDDQAREQLENELIEVGGEQGMTDSRAFATSTHTTAQYEGPNGAYHVFHFAPIGSDAVLPL